MKGSLVGNLQHFDRRQNTEQGSKLQVTSHAKLRPGTVLGSRPHNADMTELPPIVKRPGSGTSRLSSRGSSNEIPRGSILKYERRSLISLDNFDSKHSRSLGSESSFSRDKELLLSIDEVSLSNDINNGRKLSALPETNGVEASDVPKTPEQSTPRKPRIRGRTSSSERSPAGRRTPSMKSLISDKSQRSKGSVCIEQTTSIHRVRSDHDLKNYVAPHVSRRLSGASGSHQGLSRRASAASGANSGNYHTDYRRPSTSSGGKAGEMNQATRNRQTSAMRHVSSNPSFNGKPREVKIRARQTKTDDDGYDSDSEKERRILEWLKGIEGAERPPSPDIYEEEPVQTDTSIHIIYDGD